jgi:CBS domain-containing protein
VQRQVKVGLSVRSNKEVYVSVGRLCTRVVATASPGENIRTAAQRMADHEVGTLVIEMGHPRQPVGLLTDRDIALRCVAGRLDPSETPVSELMSTPVHSVDEHTPVDQAVARMAKIGIRRLIVTDEKNSVVGILSLDDILERVVEEAGAVGRLLKQQKPRIPA